MRRAAVRGVGELPQGRSAASSTMELHADLIGLALADAGHDLAEIDALLTVSPRSDSHLVHAVALAQHLGITPEHCFTVEAGGTAPMLMLAHAHALVDQGQARVAVVVAADRPLTGVTRDAYVGELAAHGPVDPDLEVPYGVTVPGLFALVARAYLLEVGLDESALAAVAVHDRAAAARHPHAHMRAPLDDAAHAASVMVADPLRLLDCAPVSDGGGALVVSASSTRAGARLRATGMAMTHAYVSGTPSLTHFAAGAALERALDRARARRADIDVVAVYDCYTVAALVNLEDMELSPRGAAAEQIRGGWFSGGGGPALNPHGGLLSHGHPARAGGIAGIIEAVVQLRGEAGDRQRRECTLAAAHGMTGVFAQHAVSVLEAAA